MAKVKVHELAKDLNRNSKDIINFLQKKGVEVKAAQSSLEDDIVTMVRKEFSNESESEVKVQTASQEKAEAPKTAENSKEAGEENGKESDTPKKKKKIIFVSNPQNSNIPGQRSQQGTSRQGSGQRNYSSQSGYSTQGGYTNSGNYSSQGSKPAQSSRGAQNNAQSNRAAQNGQNNKGKAQQAPVRPIKPLTPPSPTPSVQMVPSKPQQPKARPVAEMQADETVKAAQIAADAVEAKAAPVETKEVVAAEARPVEKVNTQTVAAEAKTAEAKAAEMVSEEKAAKNGATENKVSENKVSEQKNTDRQERNQEGRSQDNRNRENRSQDNRNRDGRGQENRGQDGRRQDGRSFDRNRENGERSQGGRYQGNGENRFRDGRGQDGRSQDGRGQGRGQGRFDGQGGDRSQGRFDGQGRGQGRFDGQGGERSQGRFNGENKGGADNGRSSYNKDGSQRPSRSGFEGGQGERRGGGSNQGGGRGFGGDRRDSRGNGGQGDRFRDKSASKGFAAEAPAKDIEKKREEEKRRFSQEKDKRNRKDLMYEEEEVQKNKPGRFIKPEKKKEEVVEEVIKVITLPETITIKELADKMRMQPAAIIKKLFLQGKIVTVNQEISYEDAENIAMEYEILCEKEEKVDVIEELLKEDEESEDDLVERPPVVCVMGHVDHGKTSLLDAIRKTNVTDKEAGGITQHIGAYTVNVGGRKITFLDTPGHEAFTAMRMRGANSTDIAILVVAADDGVMPQTIEAINHAKAAGIEIIVAVNKIDKPSANIERVKQELTEYELISEDWGGSTVFAPVSAKTGEGIEQLLEMILLTADIMELKANPKRKARGLVIEAQLDKGRGPVATVLIQKGTLHVGDFVSAGSCHGKVRAMIDDKGRRVKEAGPSTPVEILGLSDVPSAGEVILSHDSDKTAKSYAETYLAQNKEKMLEETKSRMSLDDLFSQIQEGNLKELNLIVKADVQGSVEAVKQSLMKLSNEEVVVKCIHGGVGAINESDVMLAMASSAIIIGFNVRPDATAKATAEREGVDMRLYKVIYQAIEDIEAAMKGMLDPVFEEKVIGHAEVRQIFKASAIGNIAGSYVLDGTFQRGCKVRISREGKQIYEGSLASLKRFKDDVKEVKAGFECGLVFDGFDQMQELDIVEAYIMVEVPR